MSTNLNSPVPVSPVPGGASVWATGTPLERATRGLAVLTAFSIPLSTSFSEITTGLFMAAWVLSGNLAAKWAVIRRNKVALLSLGMFGVLLAGVLWSTAGWGAALRCLLKYREFVYLPMFVYVFQEVRLRSLAVYAYMVAAVLLMGLSYLEWLTGADYGIGSAPHDYVIAKDRIIHSIMMAFLVYLAAVQLVSGDGPRTSLRRDWLWRGSLVCVIGLAVFNILCMVQGRTGYLLLGTMTTLFLCERLGRRGVVIAAALLGATAWGAVTFSSVIRARVDQTISQLQNQFGPERKHSPDPRLEFYENTLTMIRRHPLLGTGTGSFRGEYARLVATKNTGDVATSDPHNEYMHLAVQAGIPGAALFVVLLLVQWFSVTGLRSADIHVARAVVLTIALGSLFNSLILSITGGLIFSLFSGLAFADLSQAADSDAGGISEIPPAGFKPSERVAA